MKLKVLLASALAFFMEVGVAQAGYISGPAVEGGIDCSNTAAFTLRTDCVGQVTNPKNEITGAPQGDPLIDYLNGVGSLYISSTDPSSSVTPWGVQGDWVTIASELVASGGSIAGTSGFFSVTQNDLLSGNWAFDVSSLADTVIDYLVVTVKDGNGWSAYYYDLTASDISTFSDSWDTLGITNNNGVAGPAVSHMYAAYILGTSDDEEPPGEIPAPGTLLLLAAPLIGLSAWRRRHS